MRRLLALAALTGLAAPVGLAAAGAAGQEVAARGKGGLALARADLETTLLDRYAYAESGRELLDLYLKTRLLEALAVRNGVRVSDAEVTQRWQELERRSKASGQTLAEEMQKRALGPDRFREFLRLALVQEKLTRAALSIPANADVPGDKQELWLQQEIASRGLELVPPTGTLAGPLATCGEVTITRAEFARFLAERLPRDEVRETAWHLLLAAAIGKRMPDLSPTARLRAVEGEIERRRAKHAAEFPAITFEQRLGATGRTLDGLRRDPSVAIAALSRLWVDRTAGPEGLRAAYERERELFEARHGEAVRAALLFLVAGRFVNDLCPRTFDQAEDQLAKLAGRLRTQADFTAQVARLSEEPGTKKQDGDLGWVTRGEARVPAPLREALFRVLDSGGTIPEGGRVVGPVRLDSGVALLWAAERRPSPGWEEMSERVHEELRRRFIGELMPLDAVELVRPD